VERRGEEPQINERRRRGYVTLSLLLAALFPYFHNDAIKAVRGPRGVFFYVYSEQIYMNM